ncbi:hypothetical protein SK128_019943 [Halocaridina rubra]|uniref:Uncharacterized protein n=1 Tax=Halocaridina rubra TaxID=373956 RepID=A0AAN8XAD6_HALRR
MPPTVSSRHSWQEAFRRKSDGRSAAPLAPQPRATPLARSCGSSRTEQDCYRYDWRTNSRIANVPKFIFIISNLMIMLCVPSRVIYFFTPDKDPVLRKLEDELLSYAVAGSWFMMMFFAGALKLTGPFVVMIYKMISGDMFTFSIIYGIMLLGFTEAFYFLYKSPNQDPNDKWYTYGSTWMALFHMTLGDYDVSGLEVHHYNANALSQRSPTFLHERAQ